METERGSLEWTLRRWLELAEQGYRRSGIGIGAVTIRKWDADEVKFFTRQILELLSTPSPEEEGK